MFIPTNCLANVCPKWDNSEADQDIIIPNERTVIGTSYINVDENSANAWQTVWRSEISMLKLRDKLLNYYIKFQGNL